MEKHLLKDELNAMFRFHKSVLLWILKIAGCVLRYGIWLLPWIFLAMFAGKPMLAGWKVFTLDSPDTGRARQAPVSAPPCESAPTPEKSFSWETIPNKVDSGIRTFEKISKNLRKK